MRVSKWQFDDRFRRDMLVQFADDDTIYVITHVEPESITVEAVS